MRNNHGGIFCGEYCSAKIINNDIFNNVLGYVSERYLDAADIFCAGRTSVTIIGNVIRQNSVEAGRWGYAIKCATGDKAIIRDNQIIGNGGGNSHYGISLGYGACASITNNIICENKGSGIELHQSCSNTEIINNVISKQYPTGFVNYPGNGIKITGCSATIINNLIESNSDHGIEFRVYGVGVLQPKATIINNTIVGNSGYGIHENEWNDNICGPTLVRNTILRENAKGEIDIRNPDPFTVTYSNIMRGYEGVGNIDADPLFVDAANGDYNLQSGSPCIDAGDPSSPLDPDGTRTDMGALYYDQSVPSRLYGDVTNNGAVTSLDASWTLQHPVGLRTLTGEDSVAADVSGRMGITAYDASLILQYAVDKISIFPVEQGGVSDPLTKALVSLRSVSVGEATPQIEGGCSVSVLIDKVDGVVAGELMLSFRGNPGDVTVSTTDLTSGYLLVHNVQDRRIRASFAGVESNTGSGSVVEVVFDGSLASLKLERVVLNEGRIPVRIGGEQTETPRAYRLGQNYPNPFNPETTISYDIARIGTVHLSIYALTGQRVRTLIHAERPVGSYSVTWDGTDDVGHDVASGLYLCRMVSGDFSATRKLVLMK